jgi:hypothetical protein
LAFCIDFAAYDHPIYASSSYHTLSIHDCFGTLNLPTEVIPLSPGTGTLLLCQAYSHV